MTDPHADPRARPTDRGVDSIAHLDDRGQALALDHHSTHERHLCVAPDCGQHARTAFAAREYGRLAGRAWQPGDVIDLCAAHADLTPCIESVDGYIEPLLMRRVEA